MMCVCVYVYMCIHYKRINVHYIILCDYNKCTLHNIM